MVLRGFSDMWSAGHYAFLLSARHPGGTLLDERTGTGITIYRPGCGVSGGSGVRVANPLGGSWLMLNCGTNQVPKPTLYSIARKTWTTVAVSPSLYQPHCTLNDSDCGAFPIAVGSRWIEFDITCYHCGDTYVFENLRTGAVRRDPTAARVIPDLNAPNVASGVCAPLSVPQIPTYGQPIWGALTFYGSFAIATGQTIALEKCGSRLHRAIDPNLWPMSADSHAAVWATAHGDGLDGITYATLHGFHIRMPSGLRQPRAISVVPGAIYALDSYGSVWRIAVPRLR